MTYHASRTISLSLTLLAGLLLGLVTTDSARAQATLRSDITVNGNLVTLGDLFDNVDFQSDKAVFRAPSIGQSGTIRAERVIRAARNAGLTDIDRNNIRTVRVERASHLVTENDIIEALTELLQSKGYLSTTGDATVELNTPVPDQHASTQVVDPIAIRSLRFDRTSGRFSARLLIGGRKDLQPIRLAGRAMETMLVPVMTRNMRKGEIVEVDDVVMQSLPKRQAMASKPARIADIIGKETRQSIRTGSIATTSYFTDPNIINRSDIVTIQFNAGNLTLTMRGKALEPGAKGDIVTVQNLQTHRIVRGVVKAAGLIEVGQTSNTLASLGGKIQ